jgi:hypothetical protein
VKITRKDAKAGVGLWRQRARPQLGDGVNGFDRLGAQKPIIRISAAMFVGVSANDRPA